MVGETILFVVKKKIFSRYYFQLYLHWGVFCIGLSEFFSFHIIGKFSANRCHHIDIEIFTRKKKIFKCVLWLEGFELCFSFMLDLLVLCGSTYLLKNYFHNSSYV